MGMKSGGVQGGSGHNSFEVATGAWKPGKERGETGGKEKLEMHF